MILMFQCHNFCNTEYGHCNCTNNQTTLFSKQLDYIILKMIRLHYSQNNQTTLFSKQLDYIILKTIRLHYSQNNQTTLFSKRLDYIILKTIRLHYSQNDREKVKASSCVTNFIKKKLLMSAAMEIQFWGQKDDY